MSSAARVRARARAAVSLTRYKLKRVYPMREKKNTRTQDCVGDAHVHAHWMRSCSRVLNHILHLDPLKFVYWIFIRSCFATKPYFSIHASTMDAIGKNYCAPHGERSPVSADGRFSSVPLLFFFIFSILSTEVRD